jgi:hypothetical protein
MMFDRKFIVRIQSWNLMASRLGNDPGIPVLIQDQYRGRFILIRLILD